MRFGDPSLNHDVSKIIFIMSSVIDRFVCNYLRDIKLTFSATDNMNLGYSLESTQWSNFNKYSKCLLKNTITQVKFGLIQKVLVGSCGFYIHYVYPAAVVLNTEFEDSHKYVFPMIFHQQRLVCLFGNSLGWQNERPKGPVLSIRWWTAKTIQLQPGSIIAYTAALMVDLDDLGGMDTLEWVTTL